MPESTSAAPAVPAGVAATDDAFTDRIRVTWNVASGAAVYEVWRSGTNDSSSAIKVSAQDVIGTRFDDTSATVGVTYWYWVKAKNAVGPSGFSGSDQGRRADHVDAPAITSVSPDSLPAVPLSQLQPLTIHGSGFSPTSSLRFLVNGVSQYNSDPARLTFVDSAQLRYNISVGPDPTDWTVTVINGTVESNAMPFTVTAVDDTIAPAAPVTPTAEFVGKFTHNLFCVDWVNPPDASGLSKIWWKLGSPPTSDTDGIGLELPLFQPLPIVSDTDQTLYLWLEDGVGNKDYANNSSVLLIATFHSSEIVQAEAYSTYSPSQRKLAVTSDEHLHVVYHREDAGGVLQIFHAESADGGKTWADQQVTLGGAGKQYPVVAVDSNDVLHSVYEDANHATYYMRKTETWQAAEWVASYATTPAVAVDSNDHVHVVHGVYIYSPGYWGGGNGIRWRVRNPEGWQAEESISSNKYWTRYPAIAIDANNRVHVAWSNAPRAHYNDVHYRVRTSSAWGLEVEVNAETPKQTTSGAATCRWLLTVAIMPILFRTTNLVKTTPSNTGNTAESWNRRWTSSGPRLTSK